VHGEDPVTPGEVDDLLEEAVGNDRCDLAPESSGPPVYTGYPGSDASAMLSGSRNARLRLKMHSLAPIAGITSASGSSSTPKRRS
jgi:hypothetical protein